VGVSRDCPFFDTSNYFRNGWSYGLQIWQEHVHSEGPSEQKSIKHFSNKGAWAYPGTASFLGCLPPIIPGTNFKFCTHIHSINREKSLLKISGKVAVVRDSRQFSGHSYIGASRGHLCDSSAFLLRYWRMKLKIACFPPSHPRLTPPLRGNPSEFLD